MSKRKPPTLEKSFASHPKASCWSARNTDFPKDCFISSNKKYRFDCDACPHLFESPLSDISKGSWCPYCAGKKLCGDCDYCFKRSFASHEKASCWSEDNPDKPIDVAISSHKKCRFDCDVCSHSFDTRLYSITNGGTWCPYCAGKKLCGDCDYCFKRSFASHEKASCWSEDNPDKPIDVTISSDAKRKFDCDVCAHSFYTRLYHVTKGHWCPHCKTKTETKLYDYLKTVYPTTVHQFRVEWCKNKQYLPFDFCIPDLKIIIELDGAQHFKQVQNWMSPGETLENDHYKERCATDNEYNVIRLLQEDVWNDRYDWKAKLTSVIEDVKNDNQSINVIYIYEDDEYDNHLTL